MPHKQCHPQVTLLTHLLSTTQSKPQCEFAMGGKNQNFQGFTFFLLSTLKRKSCIFIYILYFCSVQGQTVLMIADDQTSIKSVLCPTLLIILIITSKEKKKTFVNKSKNSSKRIIPSIPATFFMDVLKCIISTSFVSLGCFVLFETRSGSTLIHSVVQSVL